MLRLEVLLEKGEDLERAEVAFRAMYRLEGRRVGRPKYPEFSWDFLEEYLDHYAVRLRVRAPRRPFVVSPVVKRVWG